MNNYTLKILFALGVMFSTPIFGLSQSLVEPMSGFDSAAASAAPGGQTGTKTYLQFVEQQINSLSGFGPVEPFLQCVLVKFDLTENQSGIKMVGGSNSSCATASGLNPATGSTGPTGTGASGSTGGNQGQGVGGGRSNNPHNPEWWGGGVFQ